MTRESRRSPVASSLLSSQRRSLSYCSALRTKPDIRASRSSLPCTWPVPCPSPAALKASAWDASVQLSSLPYYPSPLTPRPSPRKNGNLPGAAAALSLPFVRCQNLVILKLGSEQEKRLSIYRGSHCQHFLKGHGHLANLGRRGGSGTRAEERNQQLF